MILIGTKSDLRDDPLFIPESPFHSYNNPKISHEEGSQMALKIGAFRYFETSAKVGSNIREVFEFAAKVAFKGGKGMKSGFNEEGKGMPCKVL